MPRRYRNRLVDVIYDHTSGYKPVPQPWNGLIIVVFCVALAVVTVFCH